MLNCLGPYNKPGVKEHDVVMIPSHMPTSSQNQGLVEGDVMPRRSTRQRTSTQLYDASTGI